MMTKETAYELDDAVPAHLLEPLLWTGPGYQPVVDFGGWRTALMNFDPKYRPAALRVMEAHRETDEVFVLLKGKCMLFFGELAGSAATPAGAPAAAPAEPTAEAPAAAPAAAPSAAPLRGIARVYAADMRPGIVYNVRKGAFHTHALSEDAVVLVVENRDTGDHNTDFLPIGEQGLQQLETLARRSWAWE